VVTASEKPYLTIHDYITAVHPWLMGLREKIIEAMNIWDDEALLSEKKMIVNLNGPDDLMFQEEQDWINLQNSGRNLNFGPVPEAADTSSVGARVDLTKWGNDEERWGLDEETWRRLQAGESIPLGSVDIILRP
jgi:hypothetical protein